MKDDEIFIPIKAYIIKNEKTEKLERKKLNKKEQRVHKHLEETLQKVQKLNIRSNYIRVKKEQKEKQTEEKSKEKF